MELLDLKIKRKYTYSVVAYNKGEYIEGCVYCDNPDYQLFCGFYDNDDNALAQFKADYESKIEQFEQGYIDCADCRKAIKYAENRGQKIWSGIYCKDCWELRRHDLKKEYENLD